MIPSKPVNFLAPMIAFAVALLLLSRFLEFPSLSSPLPSEIPSSSSILSTPSSSFSLSPPLNSRPKEAFSDLKAAFASWDEEIGCARFRERHNGGAPNASAVQDSSGSVDCEGLGPAHVSVLVKGWTWIPDNLDNLYSCRCGLSCLWTKSPVMADKPDALLFENVMPPARDTLIYWSSSRCLAKRNQLAGRFLSLVPHHSFGKCLNNVGGLDMVLSFYPECSNGNSLLHWWDHLHCAMSHYKFVLAIENTVTESYVTEKLYYALDAGAVPIYFGAPNVWDFVPPNSIIDGSKFSSMSELASYVKAVADDPVAYAEFHAWRRCGVLGNYGRVRAASLDTLPCRLCEFVSRKEAREGRTS
ncbi:hypothetical protein KFK09_013992 [Dendrobium nobile]|uniref:Fucosyltransferase n=1 Tax=Dendrobium nobile TaxID=94219 RepID=A0A8T3BAG4_DENNO|nr:hypothetical protein KFK09_013992 [Dendrobium nobile]